MPTHFHQEMCIRDLNFEFENLESTKSTDPAQAATATLHKNWLDIESVEVRIQKGFSNLFSSGRAQKAKLEMKKELQDRKAREALKKYYEQGEPRKGDHHADLTQICQI